MSRIHDPARFIGVCNDARLAEDDHTAELEGELQRDIGWKHLPQLARLETDPGVALDIGADPPRDVRVEDDLVIGFVEPEGAWVQEWLTVARRSDMSHFCFAQKGADPFVVPLIFRQRAGTPWVDCSSDNRVAYYFIVRL